MHLHVDALVALLTMELMHLAYNAHINAPLVILHPQIALHVLRKDYLYLNATAKMPPMMMDSIQHVKCAHINVAHVRKPQQIV